MKQGFFIDFPGDTAMLCGMDDNDVSPLFALSPECLAAETATPRAEARGRRFGWLAAGLALLSALPIGFVGGWLAFCLYFFPLALAICWFVFRRQGRLFRKRRELWRQPFPAEAEAFLRSEVHHYRRLDETGRELFRQRAKLFLNETVFHGAGVEVTDELRLLAAAAAVIPTLGFPEWQWAELREVIFRPEGNADGSYTDDGGVVTEFAESGMIGMSGVLSGVMMLSSDDLLWEFAHPEEGMNVGFHEFAHLMALGGDLLVPEDRAGWGKVLVRERRRVSRGESLLDEYAVLNSDELFAVSSELFFTIPHMFRIWHRELYAVLRRAYRQNPCAWLEDCGPPPEAPRRRRRRRKDII